MAPSHELIVDFRSDLAWPSNLIFWPLSKMIFGETLGGQSLGRPLQDSEQHRNNMLPSSSLPVTPHDQVEA